MLRQSLMAAGYHRDHHRSTLGSEGGWRTGRARIKRGHFQPCSLSGTGGYWTLLASRIFRSLKFKPQSLTVAREGHLYTRWPREWTPRSLLPWMGRRLSRRHALGVRAGRCGLRSSSPTSTWLPGDDLGRHAARQEIRLGRSVAHRRSLREDARQSLRSRQVECRRRFDVGWNSIRTGFRKSISGADQSRCLTGRRHATFSEPKYVPEPFRQQYEIAFNKFGWAGDDLSKVLLPCS